jgi:hypothetical protein
LAKIYYRPGLEAIQDEEIQAKLFGEGAAHEWRQGLTTRGKTALADANRWASWEKRLRAEQYSALGFSLTHVLRDRDPASFRQHVEQSRDSADAKAPAPSENSQGKSNNQIHLHRDSAHEGELRPKSDIITNEKNACRQ